MVEFNELSIDSITGNLTVDVSVKQESYYDNVYLDKISIMNQDDVNTSDITDTSKAKNVIICKEEYTVSDLADFLYDYILEGSFTYYVTPLTKLQIIVILNQHPDYTITSDNKITYTKKVSSFDISTPLILKKVANTGISGYHYELCWAEALSVEDIDTYTSLYSTYTNATNTETWKAVLTPNELLYNAVDDLLFIVVKTKGTPSPDTPCGKDNVYTEGIVYNKCIIFNKIMNSLTELELVCKEPNGFINSYLVYKAFLLSLSTKHYTEAVKYFNKIKNKVVSTFKCSCNGGTSV